MGHAHEVNDGDLYFVIDPITREMSNISGKVKLTQYDHQSERFTFELPRYIEDHDMSSCNQIQVHYINAGFDGNMYSGIAKIDDLHIDPDNDEAVLCTWLISGNATQYAGILGFAIRFSCVSDGSVDYSWGTAIYKGVDVCDSINNTTEVHEEIADVLVEWEHKMDLFNDNVDYAVAKANDACDKADYAVLKANSANDIAAKSQNESLEAKTTATNSYNMSTEAKNIANEAKSISREATATANEATTHANEAKSIAIGAQNTAVKAKTAADNTLATINEAKATAENAMSIATQANANAEVALSSSYEKIIKTPNEMERLLAPENFGRVYKYVGDTTLMYTNGASYAVTYDETDKYLYFIEFSDTSPSDNRFYFTSAEAFSIQPVNFLEESRNIEYSKDGVNWTAYSGTAAISAGANEKLYFRGMNEGLQHLIPYRTFNITAGNKVSCRGHIGNILNYKKIARHVNPKLVYDQFRNLFAGQTRLSSAPELPFTILYCGCYTNMFQDCENLVVAPKLPATELERECYWGMFNGCKGLTTAPKLPAMVLKEDCYWNMFNGCESLTKTPELPATTLAESCYHLMFASCTGLTSLPKLPATELPRQCYSSMFLACSSIKLATTQDETYTTPWRIPSVGTTESTADGWNDGMFSVTGGTFTDEPEINTTYYGAWPAETEATTA